MQQTIFDETSNLLEQSILYYRDQPIGTIAAQDLSVEALNYDQRFVRDFAPAALVFLMQRRNSWHSQRSLCPGRSSGEKRSGARYGHRRRNDSTGRVGY